MLANLTLGEIHSKVGGTLVEGPHNETGTSAQTVIHGVSTDTRNLSEGALFVALKGENHDGHDYLRAAFDAGASAFLVGRSLTGKEALQPHIVVEDPRDALGSIARLVRDRFTGPVVGVTGSVGKTTVKEMIALVLESAFAVHKSAANFNNEIGVPQTLFGLRPSHTALVVEMGMRGLGQIRQLTQIAAPNIGVITGIGLSHIELLGSRENIATAKGELFEELPEDGLAIFPATDTFAEKLRSLVKGKSLTVAVDADADIRATDLSRHEGGWRFTVHSPWGMQKMFVPSPGRFNVENALFAVAVGGHLGIPLDSIARALLRWTAPKMRMEVLQSGGGYTILADAYNAAPDSMIAALETLRDSAVGPNGKRIAVLGDMRELGAFSADAHAMIGRALGKLGPDMLVLVGEAVKKTAAAAIGAGFPLDHLHQLDTTAEAVSLIPFVVQPGDVVLVKGSRAMELEKVITALNPLPPAEPAPQPEPMPQPEPKAEPLAESGEQTAEVTSELSEDGDNATAGNDAAGEKSEEPTA
ncbi:MAG: UDP-N-acetylmuramoyl-tripeptide--D-alanyl-D-alanine ligase [Armatimonadaceae bacterium]